MELENLHWLAGLLEGEGTFCKGPPCKPNQPLVALQMKDEDVVRRAAKLFGVSYVHVSKPKNKKWSVCYRIAVKGTNAVALMRTLYPLLGLRRKAQVERVIASYIERKLGDNSRLLTTEQIPQIREALKKENVSAVARRFNTSRTNVRRVRDGITWKNVV